MNNKKILFCTGEGIGNTIQCLPVLRTIKEVLKYDVDLWHAFGSFPIDGRLIPYVGRTFTGSNIRRANIKEYDGVVSTFWTRDYVKQLPLPLLNDIKTQTLSMDVSEVDTYMNIARDLGANESALKWTAECNYEPTVESFDVVISDGCNKGQPAKWEVKSYPRYKELVELLVDGGLSVCSIGSKNEYVEGTVDRTGLPLMKSIGLVKNSKLLISNDTGMYHCANAVNTYNIVLFTATSVTKNYDKRFHRYSVILTTDLPCQPCQANRRWTKDCTDWKCRNIDPDYIFETVLGILALRKNI